MATSATETVSMIAIVSAGFLNLSGFIWVTLKLGPKLDNLAEVMKEQKEKVSKIEVTVNAHDTDLARLFDDRDRRSGDERRNNTDRQRSD